MLHKYQNNIQNHCKATDHLSEQKNSHAGIHTRRQVSLWPSAECFWKAVASYILAVAMSPGVAKVGRLHARMVLANGQQEQLSRSHAEKGLTMHGLSLLTKEIKKTNSRLLPLLPTTILSRAQAICLQWVPFMLPHLGLASGLAIYSYSVQGSGSWLAVTAPICFHSPC